MWIHELGSPWGRRRSPGCVKVDGSGPARAALGTETSRVEARGGQPPKHSCGAVGPWRGLAVEGGRRAVGTACLPGRGHTVTWGPGDLSGASGKGEGVKLTRGPSRGPKHVDCGVHPGGLTLGAAGGYGVPSDQRVHAVVSPRCRPGTLPRHDALTTVGNPTLPPCPPPRQLRSFLPSTLCSGPSPPAWAWLRGHSRHEVPVVLRPPGRPAAQVLSQHTLPEAPVVINAYLISAFASPLQKLGNGALPFSW